MVGLNSFIVYDDSFVVSSTGQSSIDDMSDIDTTLLDTLDTTLPHS